jgi:hypothetical protein
MKNRILFILSLVWALAVTSSCKDDDKTDDDAIFNEPKNETFSHLAGDYDISVPGNLAWEAVSYPDWAVPYEDSGEAGTEVKLYVESNVEDTSREDKLVLRLSNNKEIEYNLLQHSSLDDDNNEIATDNRLAVTKGVGYGLDIYGSTSNIAGKYPLRSEIINPIRLQKYLAALNEADAYVDEDRYYSETNNYVGSSTSSVSNKMSIDAGIEAEFSGFKGTLSGSFSNSTETNEKSGYAIREVKHVVGSRYIRSGIMREAMRNGYERIFTDGFISRVNKLLENPTTTRIENFIDSYGTHVVVYGEIGGLIQLSLEMHSTEKITERDISAALEITAGKVLSGGGGVDIKDETKSYASSSKLSYRSYGGTNIINPINPNTTFETAMNSVITKENLDYFVQGLADKSKAVVIGVKLLPLYAIIPDDRVAKIVHDYILNTYQYKMTGNRSLKYAVSGFTEENTYGTLNLPAIDTKLEYYSENVPEISTTERSTIIYSGNSYGVSHDVGFFIGSNTKKPGKLRKKSDGTFVYEPFEEMRDSSQVSQIYVDANGDVKIAKTGSIDDYIQVKFESQKNYYRYDFAVNTGKVYINNSAWDYKDAYTTGNINSFTYYPNGNVMSYIGSVDKSSESIQEINRAIYGGEAFIYITKNDRIPKGSYIKATLSTNKTKKIPMGYGTIGYHSGQLEKTTSLDNYVCVYIENFLIDDETVSTYDFKAPFGKGDDGKALWPEVFVADNSKALKGITTPTPRWQ